MKVWRDTPVVRGTRALVRGWTFGLLAVLLLGLAVYAAYIPVLLAKHHFDVDESPGFQVIEVSGVQPPSTVEGAQMIYKSISFSQKFGLFAEHWKPKIVAEMNEYQFKVVKLKGDFVWHEHKDTDETFIVIDGDLRIDFRDGAVHVLSGEAGQHPGFEYSIGFENGGADFYVRELLKGL